MLVDAPTAREIGAMLDEWKTWSDGGGMTKSNLDFVMKNPVTFAYAALVVDLIKGAKQTAEGSLAADLQECITLWPKVKLG